MLRAILIDDEANSLNALKEKILSHCPEVCIIATIDSPTRGIDLIEQQQPDLVFLDIEMPVMNGFVMLQQLSFRNFDLIFTTAYDHYAIKAIRFSAMDYLVKPVEIEELKTAVEKVAIKRKQSHSQKQLDLLMENMQPDKRKFKRIAIPAAEGLQFIKVEEIIYLESSGNYTRFYLTGNNKYVASKTLKDFEDILPADIFLRIHNSYIINKEFVEKYIRGEGGQVVLANNVTLDVSKRKKSEFLKAIGY